MERSGSFGKTLTLKVKFSDFKQITRSQTTGQTIDHFPILHRHAKELLGQVNLSGRKIRLLGLSVSQLEKNQGSHAVQLEIDF